MQRSHKIRLYPNNTQATYFKQACGCARLAYNVGLAKWQELYDAGEKPTGRTIKLWFNSVKRELFPFVYAVTKCAVEKSFDNLNVAFQKFFKKQAGYPKFKKKGRHDAFYVSNDKFRVENQAIYIPKLGMVRMAESLRFEGKLVSAVISCRAGLWFVAIAVEIPDKPKVENQDRRFIGIDVGLEKLVTTSDGWYYESPRTLINANRKLRRLSKSLSRKQVGSANWKKAKLLLARFHHRIACIRNDHVHKLTTELATDYTDVCLEDLNIRGMLKNRCLARHIAAASWFEIRRQLTYKTTVHLCGRFEPSSKTCSKCGASIDLALSDRWISCSCGNEQDRDVNAANNILRWASPDVTPVEMRALATAPGHS